MKLWPICQFIFFSHSLSVPLSLPSLHPSSPSIPPSSPSLPTFLLFLPLGDKAYHEKYGITYHTAPSVTPPGMVQHTMSRRIQFVRTLVLSCTVCCIARCCSALCCTVQDSAYSLLSVLTLSALANLSSIRFYCTVLYFTVLHTILYRIWSPATLHS